MPQLNFNMLATEGPQSVYQGFMQGQQLQNKMLADQQALEAQRQTQQLNALKMRGVEQDYASKVRAEKANLFKEGLLRAATPEAARTLIKRQYSDPDLGPFLQRSIPIEDALAEISDDPAQFEKFKMQEALGMSGYIKSQEPKVTPTGDVWDPVKREFIRKPTTAARSAPVAVVGPDNKPVLVSREDAIGKTPATAAVLKSLLPPAAKNSGVNSGDEELLGKAILDGRLDPNKVNSKNAKIYAGALRRDPEANLLELGVASAGALAGERSLGVQTAKMSTAANEANKMIGIARGLSDEVDRTEFPTINAISNAVSRGTGDVKIVQLNTALNALVNSYARAISPTGAPTVSDKNHAREVVNAAYSNNQLNGILDIMQSEMAIAREAAGTASTELKAAREKSKGRATENASRPTGVGADWTLMADKNGNKAWVSPDRKSFKEVK